MIEEEILIALKEIHARYCIPASEQNYTDKDYACMQYEKLVIHLQIEIDRLNNIINELECWLRKNLPIEEKNDLQICLNKLEQLKNKKIYGSSKYEVVYFGEALGSDKE